MLVWSHSLSEYNKNEVITIDKPHTCFELSGNKNVIRSLQFAKDSGVIIGAGYDYEVLNVLR